MIRETYRGRKLKVARGGPGGCRLAGPVNGQTMPARYGVPGHEVIAQLRRDSNFAGQALLVDSGEKGLHPKAAGGPCRHPSCRGAW